MKFITTSWDDGHPLDFRVAELLNKYNLKGTFYIPKANQENEVMTEKSIVELSDAFEIGGHTLNHIRLNRKVRLEYSDEILGSFNWIKQLIGKDPVSFCFPGGVYNNAVIKCAFSSGYRILRSTELLSIQNDESRIIGTSIQMYDHDIVTYFRHLIKRRKAQNLIQWLLSGPTDNLIKLIHYYLYIIEQKGHGVFHLWGHSWEIEKYDLWSKLEEVLRHLASYNQFKFITNGELLNPEN